MDETSESSFSNLWQRINAQGDPHKIYQKIVKCYCEPHRKYHTLKHIAQCLREFEEVRNIANNPDAIEFAIWFHDIVYNTRLNNNEEESAKVAFKEIHRADLPMSFGQTVVGLILATKHNIVPSDIDTQLMMDIDLSIFGQHYSEIIEYEKNIRQEYDWVDDVTFIRERTKILQSFIDRPRIYFTDYFQHKYKDALLEIIASKIILNSSQNP